MTDATKGNFFKDPVDGVMGLALGETNSKMGPLFAKELFPFGLVTPTFFSFHLSDPGKKSWIDWGGWRKDAIKDEAVDRIVWLDMSTSDFFWSSNC